MQTEQTKSILIDGKWRDGETLREVVNLATGEVVSRQAEVGDDGVREAIDTASEALDGWCRTSAYERSQIFGRVATLLLERADCFFAPELLAAPSFEKLDPELLQTEIFGPLVLVAGFSELDRLIPGLNHSGLGREGRHVGLEEFLEVQYLVLKSGTLPAFDGG